MGCGAPLKRALEGLDGVKAVEMRFPKKEFEVQYDPEKVKLTALLETATNGGKFQSKADGAIKVRLDAPGLKLEGSSDKAHYGKKAKGTLNLKLTPESGKQVAGAKLTVTTPKALTFTKSKVNLKTVSKAKDVALALKVAKKAEAGSHDVVIKISYLDSWGQPQEATLRIPVSVE